MSGVRVHVAPLSSGLDVAANRSDVVQAVRRAADDGARLVILPEYACAFDPRGTPPHAAEPLDGPFLGALLGVTEQTGLVVVAGTLLPGRDPERAVNAVVAVGSGTLLGVYRKVHLYDAFGHQESDVLDAGPADQEPLVVEVDGLQVGVMTCYDLRFPESARRLVDAGATVVAVPAAWAAGERKAEQWRVLLQARAIEDVAYALGSVQRGPGVTGDALAVDPWGAVLGAGSGPAPVAVDLDPEVVSGARERNPSLQNRRYTVVPRT